MTDLILAIGQAVMRAALGIGVAIALAVKVWMQVVTSDDPDPAERRTGPEGWCWHPETETTLCGLTTCWACGTEWTEARR